MKKIFKGYSIVEMLIVIAVFSILAVIITQSLALSLRGSKKSDAVVIVKGNVDYTISTMERLLRNAQALTCSPTNPGPNLLYTDERGNSINPMFRCLGGVNGYIASGSAGLRLTSQDVYIDCTIGVFNCTAETVDVPASVLITLNGRHSVLGTGPESAQVRTQSNVHLRTY